MSAPPVTAPTLLAPNPLWDAPVGAAVDENNMLVPNIAPEMTEKWTGTPYRSKRGNPIATKTTVIMSGKSKGQKRTTYAEYVGGKYVRISLHEIKTGRKLPKKKSAKKDKCTPKKRTVSRSSAPKSEIAKARRKFNRRSKLKKKIDRSIQAQTVVTKSKDYKPNQNDFKGVDTKRR